MVHLSINVAAVITDRQSFLDGARLYTIEGEAQPATGWRMSLSLRWPMATERIEEADLALIEPGGAELSAALASGTAEEITDEDGVVGAVRLDLRFEARGGTAGFTDASGSVHVRGTIAGEGEATGGTFEGEGALLTVDLDIQGESGVWSRSPAQRIPTGPDAAF
jgi:hypothetical protein